MLAFGRGAIDRGGMARLVPSMKCRTGSGRCASASFVASIHVRLCPSHPTIVTSLPRLL
jgi:hypothetical protein